MRTPVAVASLLVSIAVVAALAACQPARRPVGMSSPEVAETSLFASDAAVLPDDAIARILAHAWSAPAKARVAVLRVGQRSAYYRWSDEFAKLDGQLRE